MVFKNKQRQHKTRHNVTQKSNIHHAYSTEHPHMKTKKGGHITHKKVHPADPIAFQHGVTKHSADSAHKIRNTGLEWASNMGNRVHRTTLRETKKGFGGGPKFYRPTESAIKHTTLNMTERMTGATNQPYQRGYLYEFHGDGTYTRHRDADYTIDMMSGENV